MRRERNKLAAAKCRNRRKELTDFLQAVSPGWCGGWPGPGPPNLRGARLPGACRAPGAPVYEVPSPQHHVGGAVLREKKKNNEEKAIKK